jgi:hypothetical protein
MTVLIIFSSKLAFIIFRKQSVFYVNLPVKYVNYDLENYKATSLVAAIGSVPLLLEVGPNFVHVAGVHTSYDYRLVLIVLAVPACSES